MCGRFFIDDDMKEEINRVITKIDKNLSFGGKRRDVTPGMNAPIIRNKQNEIVAESFKWGFSLNGRSGLLINARSETVEEKPSFQESYLLRRCIVPVRGFYEWDISKNQFEFYKENQEILYLAGIYKKQKEKNRFVILTTSANASMKPVHDRMPVVIPEKDITLWMDDVCYAKEWITKIPPSLIRHANMEQLRLDFLK